MKIREHAMDNKPSHTSPASPNCNTPTLTTPPRGSSTTPVTPLSATQAPRPSVFSSLSQKRGPRQSPGIIDFSSLPRFPVQITSVRVESSETDEDQGASSTSGLWSHAFARNAGALTPHAPASDVSGSTPRAVPDRPGLFSRWSTDSEGGGSDSGAMDDSNMEHDSSATDEDDVDAEMKDGNNADDANEEWDDACAQCQVERSGNGAIDMDLCDAEDDAQLQRTSRLPSNPFFAPQFTMSSTPVFAAASPAVSSPLHRLAALSGSGWDAIRSPLPVSSPSQVNLTLPPAPKPHQHGFSPMVEIPTSAPLPLHAVRSVSSPLPLFSRGTFAQQSQPATRYCNRGHVQPAWTVVGSNGSSPADSPGGLYPAQKQQTQALTRSQGLRIRDDEGRPRRGKFVRSLSLNTQLASFGLNSHATASNEQSSPIKAASALLERTISPAATTTDPLRVKLREMPGALTPDVSEAPPSPSPSSFDKPHQLALPSRMLTAGSRARSFGPASPLIMSFLPDAEQETESTLPNARPNAGGEATQSLPKDNPYFAGFS
ncbi:hypothetical protein EMMF5_005031 [Cystobasidiomycetes sp. EMM_F5]